MSKLTKAQFCARWDISRPTLDRWIKPTGNKPPKISVDRSTGKTLIDESEALRNGLQPRPEGNKQTAVEQSQAGTIRSHNDKVELYERIIKDKDHMIHDKEEALQRALQDVEHWRKRAEQVALIEDQRDQAVIEATRAKAAADDAEARRRDFTQKITKLTDEFEKRASGDQRERRKLEAKIAAIEERGLIARLFNWKHDP